MSIMNIRWLSVNGQSSTNAEVELPAINSDDPNVFIPGQDYIYLYFRVVINYDSYSDVGHIEFDSSNIENQNQNLTILNDRFDLQDLPLPDSDGSYLWQFAAINKDYLLDNYLNPITLHFKAYYGNDITLADEGDIIIELIGENIDSLVIGPGEIEANWGIEVFPESPISREETNQIHVRITPPQNQLYWDMVDWSEFGYSFFSHTLLEDEIQPVFFRSFEWWNDNRDPLDIYFTIKQDVLDYWPLVAGGIRFFAGNQGINTVDQTTREFNFDFLPLNPDYIPNFWQNEYTLTSDRTNIFEFRKDMRNALQDVLDSTIRQAVIENWEQLYQEEGVDIDNWEPLALQNSERTRYVNAWVTGLLYNMESIFNFLGESQVQALYAGIYSHLERLRNNLRSHIDTTVQATQDNLLRLEELVNILQQKVNHEILMNYEISLPSIPLNQIKAYLYKTNSKLYWDIKQSIRNLNGQLIIDFENLANIVNQNSQSSDYFQPWFIRIIPNYSIISTYIVSNDNILSAVIQESDVNILGSTIFDANGKVYKIVNKDGDNRWILTEPISQDVRDQPLTIVFNYFEPQTIGLKFAWKHNYIPKAIPLGIELPKYDKTKPEIIAPPVQPLPETVEPGQIPETNREIF